MSVVARVSVPADGFPLGRVLRPDSGRTVRLETVVPTGEGVVPYVWVPNADADAIEAALDASPLAEDVHVVERTDEETLFGIRWTPPADGLVAAIEASDGALLEGTGAGDRWSLRLRFPASEQLSAFYRTCRERGLALDLQEVHDPAESSPADGYGLTERQCQTLLTALEAGYFDVPRRVTLVELAERLDVSDSAASQRLRRGLAALLSATLAHDCPHEESGDDA